MEVDVGVVTEVWVYPVKGLRGRRVNAAQIEPWGFAGDRRWMIVDANGRFLSQREAPRMARVDALASPEGLALSCEGLPDFEARTPDATADRLEVTIWRDRFDAPVSPDDPGGWLAEAIGEEGCRLVYMPEPERMRPISERRGYPGRTVTFSDGAPLLVTNPASLVDLNARLNQPVPMDRFRPNIVVEGYAPWAEDSWSRLAVGEDAVLEIGWTCARCVVTTTDQATGARAPDGEPLRTLMGFRRDAEGGAIFGQNLVPLQLGEIRVGDRVDVS